MSEPLKPIYVPHMVMSIVGEMAHVRRWHLVSRDRDDHLAWSRHIAVFLVETATKRTRKAISTMFGGRDKATIWHSIDVVKRHLVAPNPDVALAINAVRYCRELHADAETFEQCLRRATSLLLQEYRRYIAVRNARWTERMRSKPRPRGAGGRYA